jgi:RNA polymerase sigma-70 factor (ECF subfamily)
MTKADIDLIRAAGAGDDNAWEALVAAHQQVIFRFAYLLLRDPQEAEDVAQETFIRAYRFLWQFDASRNWRSWLLGICANVARNRQRSLSRYLTHLRRLAQQQMTETVTPADPALQDADVELLRQAIAKLDSMDQEIVYLRYFLDLSVDETAETLNVAAGTVKSRLHRALGRLRGILQRDFPILWEERGGR